MDLTDVPTADARRRRLIGTVLIVAGALLLFLGTYYNTVSQWQDLRHSCRVANAARDDRNLAVRANRRGWYSAALARRAAFERDGNSVDRETELRYYQVIRDLNIEPRRDCIRAYPPPLLVPAFFDTDRDDPLSRPKSIQEQNRET